MTAEATNTVVVETIGGYSVTFNVANGIIVDDGAITNGAIRAVVSGGSLTFKVEAVEGHRIGNVIGATDNGDGTYTVSNVTANKTVTITSVKQYKVTYVGNNTSVYAPEYGWGYDNFEIWLDNNATVTFTVDADNGYTVMSVSGVTNNFDGTYTLTVNGSDFTVTATVVANSNLTIADEMLGFENRTGWNPASNPDHYYFAMTYTGGTNLWLNTAAGNLNGYWNDHPEKADSNNGVDIMEYIHINGKSVRSIVMDNKNGVTSYTGTSFPFHMGSWYSPVIVECSTGSGLIIRILNDYANSLSLPFSITIKQGFTVLDEHNNRLYVTEDLEYTFNGSSFTKVIKAATIDVTDKVGIEDRAWSLGNATDYAAFGFTYQDGVNGWLGADASLRAHWNDHASLAGKNDGVDIMEYILINGKSARAIVTENATNRKYGNSSNSFPFSMNGVYAPIDIEPMGTDNGGLWIKIMTEFIADQGGQITITIKAGFKILGENGDFLVVNSDINYTYNGSALTRI